jgi:Manganese containing catalase
MSIFGAIFAAEARAKIVYERLIDFCHEQGSEDGLQFLMRWEITHLKAFMVALEAMSKDPLSIGLIRQRQRWLTSISTLRPVRAIWAKPIFSGHGTITIRSSASTHRLSGSR